MAREILIQSFEITATDLPTQKMHGSNKRILQVLHVQSDYSDQGVNWILTARSAICGLVVGNLSK